MAALTQWPRWSPSTSTATACRALVTAATCVRTSMQYRSPRRYPPGVCHGGGNRSGSGRGIPRSFEAGNRVRPAAAEEQ
jgi:hypothetical protein